MKNSLSCSLLLAGVCLSFAACEKEVHESSPAREESILQVDDGLTIDVETKASAISSVPSSLYWGASTGSSTEDVKWAAASASTSSGKIKTGKYQSSSPTSYNYYVANQTFTVAGNMTVSNNNTDIVFGRTAQSTSTTPSVTLNHIFCRTGSLTLNTQSGYTLSNVSWKIVGKSDINGTAGVFNTQSSSWSSASTKLSTQTTITSSSDLYLIPGTYTFYISYTLTKGDYQQSFTKHADATLEMGKINNITATAVGGSAAEIVISVSVTAWGSNSITLQNLS